MFSTFNLSTALLLCILLQLSQQWATAVNSVVEDNSPISKIVGGLSTWWAKLDPAAAGDGLGGEDPTIAGKVSSAHICNQGVQGAS